MTTPDDVRSFNVTYELTGKSVGKMRNEITGRQTEPNLDDVFNFATDEGEIHGGDKTAPPPLSYFCTGLIACLMTQLRAFSKRLRIDIKGVEVKAKICWEAQVRGREPYTSRPVEFQLDIELDTEASLEDQKRLLEAAKAGCFVEATLANPIPVKHRLRIDQSWIAAD
jgi:uncharacterized OsmC-like protein